jgi:hypothetical protein
MHNLERLILPLNITLNIKKMQSQQFIAKILDFFLLSIVSIVLNKCNYTGSKFRVHGSMVIC